MRRTQEEISAEVNSLQEKIADVLEGNKSDIVLLTLLHMLKQEIEKHLPNSSFYLIIQQFMGGLFRGMIYNPEDN